MADEPSSGGAKETVKPGSWVGDSVEEFKKLPTWGKFLAVAILIAVAGFAYYKFKTGSSTTAGALGGIAPTTNCNPTTDPNCTSSSGTGGSAPAPPIGPPTPNPNPTPFSWLGNIPLFSVVQEGGVNANGTQRWWFTPPGGKGTEFDVPIGTIIKQGADGRWWYWLPGGQQQELTGGSNPPGLTPQIPQIQSPLPNGNATYFSPSKLSNHVVQPGETSQSIAARTATTVPHLAGANSTTKNFSPGVKINVPKR